MLCVLYVVTMVANPNLPPMLQCWSTLTPAFLLWYLTDEVKSLEDHHPLWLFSWYCLVFLADIHNDNVFMSLSLSANLYEEVTPMHNICWAIRSASCIVLQVPPTPVAAGGSSISKTVWQDFLTTALQFPAETHFHLAVHSEAQPTGGFLLGRYAFKNLKKREFFWK